MPCSTIAEHSVEGCDHFSHDGHDDDLGFFVGGDEAIVEGFEGGTVTACTEGGHVEDVTDRHPTTIDAAVSLELAAVEVIRCEADEGGRRGLRCRAGADRRARSVDRSGNSRADVRHGQHTMHAKHADLLDAKPSKVHRGCERPSGSRSAEWLHVRATGGGHILEKTSVPTHGWLSEAEQLGC